MPTAGSLAADSLASFQGPALLSYNDGKVFSEEDYASISSLGNSVKKSEKGKTGRFGVGFNAAYHLTDLPSFISGKSNFSYGLSAPTRSPSLPAGTDGMLLSPPSQQASLPLDQ